MLLTCQRLVLTPHLALTHYRPAMPFGNKKNILEDLSSLVFSQFKKYQPSKNLKFNHLGILKT